MILVFLERLFYRIEDMLKPSVIRASLEDQDVVEPPSGGAEVSVEMALNSRCSSDYDGNPRKFHWGMFEETKTLSVEQIGKIIELATIPRFTHVEIRIISDGNSLFFLIDDLPTGKEKDWVMVECGMQQQAVGLICSAFGVGMAIKSLGKDGICVSESEYAAVKARIDAMKPSYQGSYWSGMAPTGRQSWVTGNLPEPIRDSNTWGGFQRISSIYTIYEDQLSIYCNWEKSRPTHSLIELSGIPRNLMYLLSESFLHNDTFIVLNRIENHARSFWEVGYQLFNILIQAKALDIRYQAALLNEIERKLYRTSVLMIQLPSSRCRLILECYGSRRS
jgi:hypothetical protein